MTSSLSASAAAAAAACCKTRTSTTGNPLPPEAPQPSKPVIRSSSSRRKLVLFSAAAAPATGGVIQAPCGQANPFAAANGRPPPASTPYSQSQAQQQFGLDSKGRIRACPSTNPGCVSTNPTVGASCSLASPLIIPAANTPMDKAAASLRAAILKTQRNAVIKADEETAYGHYIQAEVDGGGLSRDVMEFLLKEQEGLAEPELLAAYRCVATKVTFVYPFTTAVNSDAAHSGLSGRNTPEHGQHAQINGRRGPATRCYKRACKPPATPSDCTAPVG